MVLPVNHDWKCCETCEHWGGERRFTSIGLVAEYSQVKNINKCHLRQNNVRQPIKQCQHYEIWHLIMEHSGLLNAGISAG